MKLTILSVVFTAMALLTTSCGKPCSNTPPEEKNGGTNAGPGSIPAGKITFEQFLKSDYGEKNRIIRALKESNASDGGTVALYIQILERNCLDDFEAGRPIINKRVADNLGAIGRAAAPALPALAQALAIPGPMWRGLRVHAAEAIGKIGPPVDDTVVKALVKAVNDGRVGEDYACAQALAKLGDKGRDGLLLLVASESDWASETAVDRLLETGMCKGEDILRIFSGMSEPKKSERIKQWQEAWEKAAPKQ